MADKKITDLREVISPKITDYLPIVNNDETKKVTLDNFVSQSTFSLAKINSLISQSTINPTDVIPLMTNTGNIRKVSGGSFITSDKLNLLTAFQNTSATFIRQGGNSLNQDLLIGSNDNFHLSLETSNTTRIRVLSSGNTGIGVIDPATTLEVGGSLYVRGVATNGSLYVDPGQIAVKGDANNTPTISFHNTNGTRFTFIAANDAGNIGVNTSAPNQRLTVVGNISATGNVSATGTITGQIPIGGIIMWSGSIATIPASWALCNGTNGTPDLRERFIVGAGGDNPTVLGTAGYNPNDSAGENFVTLGINQIPSHNHGGVTGTDSPDHSHSGRTGGDTPDHAHANNAGQPGLGQGAAGPNAVQQSSGSEDTGGANTQHAHDFTTGGASTRHSHIINSQGGGLSHENRPPYYALAFIMRIS